MRLSFKDKKISGILSILPEREVYFEDEVGNYTFPPSQTLRLKKIMGYEKHRLIKENSAPSDLGVYGVQTLFERGLLRPEEISALLVVTQTPDYFLPSTSSVIQGRLGLSSDVLCMDQTQACAGFVTGLIQSFMMLENSAIQKVVMINIDTMSKKTSKKDRNSYPIVGDAASVTVIERSDSPCEIYFNYAVYGEKREALMIPAGAFKTPSNEDTARMVDTDGDGNLRSMENLTMDGSSVFNFVQKEVPLMVDDLLDYAGCNKSEIDWYLFHQPNKFMLEKLADKIGVAREKMPNNVVSNYGNSSGVTIPVNITTNVGESIVNGSARCCLAGFGGGLTVAGCVLDIGRLSFCESVVSPY